MIYRAHVVRLKELTLWQKIILTLATIGALVLAVVLGMIILYVGAVAIAFALIAYAAFFIWDKFFATKPKHEHKGRVRVRRTKDGVVIDGDFEESN